MFSVGDSCHFQSTLSAFLVYSFSLPQRLLLALSASLVVTHRVFYCRSWLCVCMCATICTVHIHSRSMNSFSPHCQTTQTLTQQHVMWCERFQRRLFTVGWTRLGLVSVDWWSEHTLYAHTHWHKFTSTHIPLQALKSPRALAFHPLFLPLLSNPFFLFSSESGLLHKLTCLVEEIPLKKHRCKFT